MARNRDTAGSDYESFHRNCRSKPLDFAAEGRGRVFADPSDVPPDTIPQYMAPGRVYVWSDALLFWAPWSPAAKIFLAVLGAFAFMAGLAIAATKAFDSPRISQYAVPFAALLGGIAGLAMHMHQKAALRKPPSPEAARRAKVWAFIPQRCIQGVQLVEDKRRGVLQKRALRFAFSSASGQTEYLLCGVADMPKLAARAEQLTSSEMKPADEVHTVKAKEA